MTTLDKASSPKTHAILGSAIEVQRHFGTGLLESAYGDALEIEFQTQGIPFQREMAVPLHYKSRKIRTVYRADFICFDEIILELKASGGLGGADLAQMWHYLTATGLSLGLLVNFGQAPLQIRRFLGNRMERVPPNSVDSVAADEPAGQ